MIEKRISELSYGEDEFNSAKPDYEAALQQSGYVVGLKYVQTTATRKNRARNITYFNPPFNAEVETNVGREFLLLIDKHFPSNKKYHKIFNRNTIYRVGQINPHNYFHAVQAWILQGIRKAMV